MSERASESRARTLVRFAGITVAFALTIVAAWMIALGHSQRQNSLGVIIGLWAALIGAMTFFGGRHTSSGSGGFSGAGAGGGSDVELRQDFALELQREVSARRAYEQQLHEMVRREIETIQRVVGDQLGKLREDVATLRVDLVDQVGGKVRLERIETTRVIGSDIEALQNEVRQLAGGGRLTDRLNRPAATPPRIVDQRPVDQRPVDQRPVDQRSAEQRPAPRVVESQPIAAPPVELRPVELRPVELRPVELRPVELRPVELRGGEDRSQSDVAPVPGPPALPVGSAPPAPRPDPVPAYQPYIAPTYAPAVTYASGATGPQYSTPAVAAQPVPQPESLPDRPPTVAAPFDPPAAAPVLPAAAPTSQVAPTTQYSAPSYQAPMPSVQSQPAALGPIPTLAPSPGYSSLPPLPLPSIGSGPAFGANGGNASNGVSGLQSPADPSADPFAGLPRLSRFEDDLPDPVPPAAAVSTPPAQGVGQWPAAPAVQPPAPPQIPVPQPWQSAAEQWSAPAPASNGNGRRHGAVEDEPVVPQVGRRRRAEDDTNDVLARLLGRSS